MLFLLLICLNVCCLAQQDNLKSNNDLIVILSLHSGCSWENNDENCHAVKGENNIHTCNTPESCYYYAWHMMNINNNNTDYWIKWRFVLNKNFISSKNDNLKSGAIKSTILDNVNEISIFSGCDDVGKICDPVIGGPDTVGWCYNATGCYYGALTMWERYDMNPDYWIMMMFWEK
jgi:hypothetical protein